MCQLFSAFEEQLPPSLGLPLCYLPLAAGDPCLRLQVDKYDDPNTAVNKLMLALTGMGFDLNFPANRLKQVQSC